MNIQKNEVYYADLSDFIGSEQGGIRPVVVLQNDIGNKYAPTTIVTVITAQKKKHMPTHVGVELEEGTLPKRAVALLEQIKTIDKKRLQAYIGKTDKTTGEAIERAMRVSLGINDIN